MNYSKLYEGFNGEEGDLIPLLQRVQAKLGYISEEAVSMVSKFLGISESQIYGVASFYSQFRFNEPGRNSIKVCLGTACHVRGGQLLVDAVGTELGIAPGQTTKDKKYDFQRVACLGCCALAPVFQVNKDIYGHATATRLKSTIKKV